MSVALSIRGITKRFPRILANDRVDFDLTTGEIHALIGENGAGKSTLMNIIFGLYAPDEGAIYINETPVAIKSPSHAGRLGIGMVHQHFMLIPEFTVAENIIIGSEITRGIFLDMKRAREKIACLSHRYGMDVHSEAKIKDLTVGQQQQVEILKVLFKDASILIFDEPTAALTPKETDGLFQIMRELTLQQKSIIFITHKLKEINAVADRLTVLRKGRVQGTFMVSDIKEEQIAEMMVGRDIMRLTERERKTPGTATIEIKALNVKDNHQREAVHDVTFTIHEGEIMGLAGVQGNGQNELVEALTGLRKVQSGSVSLSGHPWIELKPGALFRMGLGHIPEDRLKHGLVLSYSVSDNQVLCDYRRPPFAGWWVRNKKAILENSRKLIERFNIMVPGPDIIVKTLSGGNQQKVVISREFNRDIRFLVANQPTRGLDIGSTEIIHREILDKRNHGVAVLLISSDLDEIMVLSDRIAVISGGKIIGMFRKEDATRETIGLLMMGEKSPVKICHT